MEAILKWVLGEVNVLGVNGPAGTGFLCAVFPLEHLFFRISAVNFKALTTNALDVGVVSLMPEHLLRRPTSVWSNNSPLVYLHQFRVECNDMSFLGLGSDSSGSFVEGEPLVFSGSIASLHSQVEFTSASTLPVSNSSVLTHSRFELEPNSIFEWVS